MAGSSGVAADAARPIPSSVAEARKRPLRRQWPRERQLDRVLLLSVSQTLPDTPRFAVRRFWLPDAARLVVAK
jgi:hypothetical protein